MQKNIFNRILYFTVLLCILNSCKNLVYDDLKDIESYIDNRPDSAMANICLIDTKKLKSEKERAKYALLCTQAQIKNHVLVTNDSLINIAVDYYSTYGTTNEKFLSLFNRGCVHINSGDYSQAMLDYTEAEQIANSLNNDYYLGLLYSQIGDIYMNSYNYSKSAGIYLKAYDHFYNAKKIFHQAYALVDAGIMYWNSNNYIKAECTLNKALEESKNISYNELINKCLCNLAIFYENYEKHSKAKAAINELMKEIDTSSFSSILCGTIAKVHAVDNNRDSARIYLNRSRYKATDISDSVIYYLNASYIYEQFGNYSLAYRYLKDGTMLQSKEVRKKIEEPIIETKMEYYMAQNEFHKYKITKYKQFMLLIALFFTLIVSIVLITIKYKIKRKNTELSKYLELANELQHNFNISCKIKSDMQQSINELFSKQFSLFNKLLGTYYYETKELKENRGLLYQEIKDEIKYFENLKKSGQELEHIIDKYKNNLMFITRTELPQLSDKDYRFLCLMYAGFSMKAISIFTGDEVNSIYVRKSRIKQKIDRLRPPHASLFLTELSI